MSQLKMYLGDGLYAEFDGFGMWVRSENGIEVLNEVYFEPEVLNALIHHAANLQMLDEQPVVHNEQEKT